MDILTEVAAAATRHPVLTKIIGAVLALVAVGTTKVFNTLGTALYRTFFDAIDSFQDNDVYIAVSGFLAHTCKTHSIGSVRYNIYRDYVKSRGENRAIFFKMPSKVMRLFFYRWAPILCIPGEKAKDEKNPAILPKILFIRGTVNVPKLLCRAATEFVDPVLANRMEARGGSFEVIRHAGTSRLAAALKATGPSGTPDAHPKSTRKSSYYYGIEHELTPEIPINYDRSDIGPDRVDDALEQLSLTGAMTELVRDVQFWISHKDWYKSRRITWRRGVLLHGEPGTGKTSIVRALAEDLDVPVHVFDLASMDNADFHSSWEQTRDKGPRIVLLEDFDAVFCGRKNIIDGSSLTFDCILNVLDGIEREDGLLLFVTTNHIEHIDPALGTLGPDGRSTRPGRIDKIVKLNGLDHDGRIKIAVRILRDDVLAEKIALEGANDTAAIFQERCAARAKADLWGEDVE